MKINFFYLLLLDDDELLQELRDMVKKLSMDVKYIREKVETIDENVINLGEIVETNGEKLDQHLNPPGKLHLPLLFHIYKKKNIKIAWL